MSLFSSNMFTQLFQWVRKLSAKAEHEILLQNAQLIIQLFFSVYKLSLFIMEPLGKFVDCSTLSIVWKSKFLRLLEISKKRKLIKRTWRVNWKEGKQCIIKDGTLAVGKKEGSRLKGKTRDCPRKMRLPTKFISEKGNFSKDFDALPWLLIVDEVGPKLPEY